MSKNDISDEFVQALSSKKPVKSGVKSVVEKVDDVVEALPGVHKPYFEKLEIVNAPLKRDANKKKDILIREVFDIQIKIYGATFIIGVIISVAVVL